LKIIKLDAIDSTNSFLKELAQNSVLDDYTTVVAKKQTLGRGQMNRSWSSEPNKNLTFSTFIRFRSLTIEHQPYLNFAVSLALYEVLESLSVPKLAIKWPNDIMSGSQKICGILIETTFAHHRIKNTVIGIGLNVNQAEFPAYLPKAASLKMILNKDFDLDEILEQLVEKIRFKIDALEHQKFDQIHQNYLAHLYKRDTPLTFKDEQSQLFFMGMIKTVSTSGRLRIQLEDDSIVEFGLKEISIATTSSVD
jgi:BirA family biotin operon repressor/biotin-[acetyl-CoA-carboxylase] ligase